MIADGPPPIPEVGPAAVQVDIRAVIATEWARDRLFTIAGTTDRSLQAHAGPSEIGQTCPRRVGHRIAGTPIVNFPDPLKAMFGTGMHEVIASGLARLDRGMGRFLIEHPVSYRGIAGRMDCHDLYTHRSTDWKTTTKQLIARYARDGPPSASVIQLNIYAAALEAAGHRVDTIALVYIPRDGLLSDLWSWVSTPDRAKADTAIDRYMEIEAKLTDVGPDSLPAQPSNLCTYCPNYRPHASDLSVACPGKDA